MYTCQGTSEQRADEMRRVLNAVPLPQCDPIESAAKPEKTHTLYSMALQPDEVEPQNTQLQQLFPAISDRSEENPVRDPDVRADLIPPAYWWTTALFLIFGCIFSLVSLVFAVLNMFKDWSKPILG